MNSNRLKLEAPWPEVKEKLKEHNYNLTDDDLQYEPGKEDELIERLQNKLGIPAEEVKALIESISFNTGMAG